MAAAIHAQTEGTLRGFSPAAARDEIAREQAFKSLPSSTIVEGYFDVMTAEPHHAGSPYEIQLADYVSDRFKEFGLEVSRYEYSILIPWPGPRQVEVVSPDPVKLQVEEEILPGDPYASKPGILPAYNAYSPSGDVTGELVYVNYGIPEDYETLQKLGIDVKGRIVVARYGGSWRGIKPKVAAEHGALGCIIYSDPRDDGYFQGDVYPEGPYRGAGMIQRGSVMDMPTYPGDPLTPGRPSKPGVERLKMEEVKTFAPIPVLPMSYRDGQELLKRLKGPVAPEGWRGALPLTYHIGPGPARVHMKLQMDYGQRRLIDVVGKITGSQFPDQWILVGSHRDAWTFGASDSVSGHVSMMDVARSFGELRKQGWRPKRSLLFISWDGEEQGLLGSTEWVEDLSADLRAKAVVYVNRDAGAAKGTFSGSAVHSLTPFVHEVARSVDDPEQPSKTLYDRWLERSREQGRRPEQREQGEQPLAAPEIGALGSGSDYTAFLDHIGVSSLDMGISGPGDSGTYHSIYDNAAWFKKFIDPGFKYSVAASQVTGLALMRFADADVLPFDHESYAKQIAVYVGEIEKAAAKASDTGAKNIPFDELRRAAGELEAAGAAAKARAEALLASGDTKALTELNRKLFMVERELIEPSGLPDRPWFRHTIYAPGLYTGYGVKTIPGVREAVEAKDFGRAAAQARLVVEALHRATRLLSGTAPSSQP
jgi:N-acetylated-alpha-linked acidic dipeptidase